jgi:hypothetical protein
MVVACSFAGDLNPPLAAANAICLLNVRREREYPENND